MAVLPGDVVEIEEGVERVVVDVAGDNAVLRKYDDMELREPEIVPAGQLKSFGHLAQVEGWTETAPGEWEKS